MQSIIMKSQKPYKNSEDHKHKNHKRKPINIKFFYKIYNLEKKDDDDRFQ